MTLPRLVRLLAMAAAAAMLLALAGGVWLVYRTLDVVHEERTRLQALEDSLRSEAPSERRLREIEQRLGSVERRLSSASRAARVPEVIALRNWARRLDAETRANNARIASIQGRMDSLRAGAGLPDSLP